MISSKSRQLLKTLGITILNMGPFKDYWELVFEAPFKLPFKNQKREIYSDEAKMFITRKTYKTPSDIQMLYDLAGTVKEYVDALTEVMNILYREANEFERTHARRDDVEDS